MRFIRNRSHQLLVDALVLACALAFAYLIRFEGHPPRFYLKQLLLVLPYIVVLRLLLMGAFGVYRLIWRYIGLRDLPRIIVSMLAGTVILVVTRHALAPMFAALGLVLNQAYSTVPYGVMAAELVLSTMGIISARTLWRFLTERAAQKGHMREPGAHPVKQKALLVGAGSAGVMVAREVSTNPSVGFEVVGFLDDDADKLGTIISGFKVLGDSSRLPELAATLGAQLVVISMANVPAAAIRRIVDLAESTGLKVQIIPGLYEILSGRVNISKIRDVAIEDLLGRDPVQLDEQIIRDFITDKVVLVTGAGGSIGSEICRQICQYRPRRLVILDQAENPLFHLNEELKQVFPSVMVVPVVASVVVQRRIQQVINDHRPDVIFHAAAHKHVPLMELNPVEAVRNNVLGTRTLADIANEAGVEAFVMISTDKAVNPTSVMGATKRIAEMFVQARSGSSKTRFLTVRFGNVLGSEGSVVPIFKDQIARGGPITVTHPDMMRYFMTIPEASQLVLQASAMGKGGEIFILEMGKPVKIVDLARDLIRLSGYRPNEDIRIEFTGIRPGEKLYEEITLSEENASKTKHPRIWIGKSTSASLDALRDTIDGLLRLIEREDVTAQELRALMARCVPEYHAENGNGAGESSQSDQIQASSSFIEHCNEGTARQHR